MELARQIDDRITVEEGAWRGRFTALTGIAGAALALSAVGFFVDRTQFAFSYLTAFVFFLTLFLGSLFVVMVHHLSRAGWIVALRRIPETASTLAPLFAVLFVPLIFVLHDLYHWTHDEVVEHDPLLAHKEPYLNVPFFLVRAVVYFLVWFLLGRYFHGKSVEQDRTGDPLATVAMQRRAAPGMIAFALTLTLAAFDWIMSLEPHWFSTIFGVYIFSGSVLAAWAFIFLVTQSLKKQGYLAESVRLDHQRDLGRWMFAFTVFWAYIAFSQFFLIWYGNIPEETIFFVHRIGGSWKVVSLLLAVLHFPVPFVVLMSRQAKLRPGVMAFMAWWILALHFVDIYWLIMPVLHHEGVGVHWLDLACLLAVGSLFLNVFFRKLASGPLMPVGDPRLPESLALENDY